MCVCMCVCVCVTVCQWMTYIPCITSSKRSLESPHRFTISSQYATLNIIERKLMTTYDITDMIEKLRERERERERESEWRIINKKRLTNNLLSMLVGGPCTTKACMTSALYILQKKATFSFLLKQDRSTRLSSAVARTYSSNFRLVLMPW